MKISKLFHTLYGCLMALPVLVIPIFAININQKSVEPISITVDQSYWEVQNKFTTNEVNDLDDLVEGNIYHMNRFYIPMSTGDTFTMNIVHLSEYERDFYEYDFYEENAYVDEYNINYDNTIQFEYYGTGGTIYFSNFNGYASYDFYLDSSSYVIFTDIDFILPIGEKSNFIQFLENEGNPADYPNISEFNVLDYVYHEDEPLTYDNTDIGSQFLYSIYKPVNDYFNFKDFMGLGSLYAWIQLNIFSGSNSLVFFILFNLFTYWIFVSFFWLIFDVLMYVPSLVHKMLDKARLE